MSMLKKVISNTSYLFLDSAVITVLGYIFWIILGKMLVPADLGTFSTIMNTALVMSAMFSGLCLASVKLISEYSANKKNDLISGTIRWILDTSVWVLIVVSIIIFVPMYLFVGLETGIVLGILFYLISYVYYILTTYYLIGLQKMKQLFVTDLFHYLVKAILVAVFIYMGLGYFSPVAAFVIASVLTVLLRFRDIPISPGPVDKKKVWFYARPGTISSLSWMVLNGAGIIFLGYLVDMRAAGIYTIAFMFSTALRMLPQTISLSILPTSSIQWTLKKMEGLNTLITKSIKYLFISMIPLIVFGVLYAEDLVLLVSTSEYLGAVFPIQLLLVSIVFVGFLQLINSTLFSTGFVKEIENIYIIGVVATIVLSYLFIEMYGINGAAIAYIISAFIMMIIGFFWLEKRLKFSFDFSSTIRILIASIIPTAAVYFSIPYLPGLIYAPLFAVIYGILFLFALRAVSVFDKWDVAFLTEVEKKVPKSMRGTLRLLKKFIK